MNKSTSSPAGNGELAGDLEIVDPMRQHIGYNLKRTYMAMRDDLLTVLEPLDLRITTFAALLTINENPQRSQSQMAKALNIERSRAVVLIDDLEGRGLIARNKVKNDRRSYALSTTAKGRQLSELAVRAVNDHEDRLLVDLSADERSLLISLLLRVEKTALKG